MKALHRQAGLGFISLILILIIGGFVLLLAFRITPAYFENAYIKNALESLARDNGQDLNTLSRSEIRTALSNYYTVNNVRGEAAKALEIDRQAERTLIRIAYEVRIPIIANIDAVLSFDNVLDSSKPDACCTPDES